MIYPIHIFFAISDPSKTYARHLGVALSSLLKNTRSQLHIHILYDSTVLQRDIDRFQDLSNEYGQLLTTHSMDCFLESWADLKQVRLSQFTASALSRLIIPEHPDFLSIQRCIYLDADIVVELDIDELWQSDLHGNPFGAVLDPYVPVAQKYFPADPDHLCRLNLNINLDTYFNSGVMLLDLDLLRQNKFFSDAIQFMREHDDLPAPDQDALNKIGNTNYCILPEKFNYCASRLIQEPVGKIVHFTWKKPWKVPCPHMDSYFRYLNETPWAVPDTEEQEQMMKQVLPCFATQCPDSLEDYILMRFFADIPQGFHITVGMTADLRAFNATDALYKRGWRGISIAPMPHILASLARSRIDDINLGVAVGRLSGHIDLWYCEHNPVLSNFTPDELPNSDTMDNDSFIKLSIPTVPLWMICNKFVHQEIHVLKIDAPHHVFDILETVNFSANRPWIICITTNTSGDNQKGQNWQQILESYGYTLTIQHGAQLYYVHAHHCGIRSEVFNQNDYTVLT